jgi:hypothetical protein
MTTKKTPPFTLTIEVDDEVQKKRMSQLQERLGTDIPIKVRKPKKKNRAKKVS